MPRRFVAETPAELERLGDLWRHLFDPSRHTLFQSFEWNLLAARFFSEREAPRVAVVETSRGAAIVPACVSARGLSFLGESLFDYRDLLSKGEDDVVLAAWREVSRASYSLEVTAIRGREPCERWTNAGFRAEAFVHAPCVCISDGNAEMFVALHNRSGRLLRRLARHGIEPRRHPGSDINVVRAIYDLKAAQETPGAPNLFSDPQRREFMVAICGVAPCDIFTLESPSSLVAAALTFRDANTRRFYTICYDNRWAHYSPGIALLFEATRISLAEGLDCDYMTGEQPHKLRFATASVPLYRVQATAAELSSIRYRERLAAA